MPAAPARPTSVTLVCLFIGFSAGLLAVNLLSLLGDWGSIAMQEGLRDTLESEPLASTGFTMDGLLDTLRIVAQVIVVMCIAAAVLAVYTARGHEASRWALTVLLALTAVAFALALPTGLLLTFFAAASISVLWSKDSRRWFAEKNGRPVPAAAPVPSARESAGADPFSSIASPAPDQARTEGGQPPAAPQHAGPTPAHPVQQHPQPATTGARPRSVGVAVWTTIGASAIVLAGAALTLLLTTVLAGFVTDVLENEPLYRDLFSSTGWTADGLIVAGRVASVVFLVLSLAGLTAGALARAGHPAGRTTLLVMSIVTMIVSVAATLGFFPINGLTFGAAVVVLVALLRSDAQAWFASRRTR